LLNVRSPFFHDTYTTEIRICQIGDGVTMKDQVKKSYEGGFKKHDMREDSEIPRVGPGTPGGECLHSAWQPVALSKENKPYTSIPTKVSGVVPKFTQDAIFESATKQGTLRSVSHDQGWHPPPRSGSSFPEVSKND